MLTVIIDTCKKSVSSLYVSSTVSSPVSQMLLTFQVPKSTFHLYQTQNKPAKTQQHHVLSNGLKKHILAKKS